eukprot:3567770-Pleurochrysis_carterae.AAC.1
MNNIGRIKLCKRRSKSQHKAYLTKSLAAPRVFGNWLISQSSHMPNGSLQLCEGGLRQIESEGRLYACLERKQLGASRFVGNFAQK